LLDNMEIDDTDAGTIGNPLYQESGRSGVNPIYQTQGDANQGL